MPRPRRVLNAFTANEVRQITGISVHMINYLCRARYLEPFYGQGTRGKVRFYSYRDLVIAQIVQRLRQTGVELARLKDAMQALREDDAWIKRNKYRRSKPVQWLVTDGKTVLLKHEDGFLDELRPGGQRSFAFVVTLQSMQDAVRARIEPRKRRYFDIRNQELMYEEPTTKPVRHSKRA
jgi:DNA-binding transcriptional MerR regulator